MNRFPLARDLVLVGGGHTHILLLKKFAMNPVEGVRITLVSPRGSATYSGMIPGYIAGHYDLDAVQINLRALCRYAGADFLESEVEGIDLLNDSVVMAGRPSLRFDAVSLDIGSGKRADLSEVQGSGISIKPINDFISSWPSLIKRIRDGKIKKLGVVGAGAAGIEVALALEHRIRCGVSETPCSISLISSTSKISEKYNFFVRRKLENYLSRKNIRIHRDFKAVGYDGSTLFSSKGVSIHLDEVLWATDSNSHGQSFATDLETDPQGFIAIRDTLQSVSRENVFAVGDCATSINNPYPKSGVYAVRQAPILFHNVRAFLLGKKLKSFRPQKRVLSLLSLGERRAIASKGGFYFDGRLAWKWKDWIDRRFMKTFYSLPEMQVEEPNSLVGEFESKMFCGGCGSKVSADTLSEVLNKVMGNKAPKGDAAVIEIPEGKVLLQSVDHFRSFLNDPYTQARIALCHAMSDVYACGGNPVSVLASITLPFSKPEISQDYLSQLVHGILYQLEKDNAELIGGHTSEGEELSIGFTVNGLAEPNRLREKKVIEPGLAIVLTKQLGVGAIFAADMQHKSKAEWVHEAIKSMLVSNRLASELATDFGVRSCTDITGFGLAGHLLEMIGPGVGVEVDLDKIPCLPGSLEVINGLKIRSSLHDANKKASKLGVLQEKSEILFDPQTSGGLVLAVEKSRALEMISSLHQWGYYHAAIIGESIPESCLRVK